MAGSFDCSISLSESQYCRACRRLIAGSLRCALLTLLAHIVLSFSREGSSRAAGILELHEKFEFFDPDPGAYDAFGWSVAIDGNFAVVGMPGSGNGQVPSRAAYVYRTDTGELVRILTPVSQNDYDGFAGSVAISGNLVVVGASGEDVETPEGTKFGAGAAHVYDLSTGNHLARLVPSDPQSNGFVGSIAIDGTHVLLGGSVGAAYLFHAHTGQQLAKMTPSTPTAQFGSSVALDGTMALIGANSDASRGEYTGAAYVFDTVTNTELLKIVPDDAVAIDSFGLGVALDGNVAIIGSSLHSGAAAFSGAAYVFDVTNGQQLAKLLPPIPPSGSAAFGYSVDIDGDYAIVGSPNDSRRGGLNGAAYLYDWTTESVIAELVPSDNKGGDSLGLSVGLSGNTVVVGAIKNGSGATHGSAYTFQIPEPSTALSAIFALCVCSATNVVDYRARRAKP